MTVVCKDDKVVPDGLYIYQGAMYVEVVNDFIVVNAANQLRLPIREAILQNGIWNIQFAKDGRLHRANLTKRETP